MELAKCDARSQRKDAKNGLYVDFEGCGRAYGGTFNSPLLRI
jgi:hypothetical protein